MSYSFQKYNSLEGSQEYTASGLNRMNFKVDSVSANGLTDLSKSYCIFSVDVNSTDYKKDGTTAIQGVVNPWRWGNSGVKYNGTSLIRNVRLDSNKGCLENIIQQNVLTQTLNINYLSSKSEQKSQDILNFYSGATHDESGLFNSSPWINYNSNGTPTSPTDYATASMILPLKETALGIAKVGAMNLNELEHENLALRFELEDQNTLDLAWDSVADFSEVLQNENFQVAEYTPLLNRNLVWSEQLTASYNQLNTEQPPVYTLIVDKSQNWLNTTDGSQSAFPFGSVYSDASTGIIKVSYVGSDLVQYNTVVLITNIALSPTQYTLTLSEALPGVDGTADGGISVISVICPVSGQVSDTALNQLTVNVPHPKNAVNNCPFTVNQTICLWGSALSAGTIGEIYKITAITRTATTSAPTGGLNYVDTYVLTIDSPLVLDQGITDTSVYMCPSANATATWAISQPQFTLATFNETPDMKTRRNNKMAGVKTSFMSWELESFTWGTNQTSYMRQWVLNPSTVSALLCTPLPNTLVSVRDNCNQVRIILNSKQLTNRPLLIDANTSAGSQFTDWVKDILKHYCGLDVKQLQQIPTDAPGSVMMVPCPIEDLRFTSSTEQRTSPHILEVQLFSPSTATMNAKTFYLFKNVVKHL
jgi:hypothetical protein